MVGGTNETRVFLGPRPTNFPSTTFGNLNKHFLGLFQTILKFRKFLEQARKVTERISKSSPWNMEDPCSICSTYHGSPCIRPILLPTEM